MESIKYKAASFSIDDYNFHRIVSCYLVSRWRKMFESSPDSESKFVELMEFAGNGETIAMHSVMRYNWIIN